MIASVYGAAFLDHFQHPRGQGALADATHTACLEDPACGDELTLDLIIASGRIQDARFRARGCMGAIAVGSAMAELLPGRPARPDALTRVELEGVLGAVPTAKRHALRLAIGVLHAALNTPA